MACSPEHVTHVLEVNRDGEYDRKGENRAGETECV